MKKLVVSDITLKAINSLDFSLTFREKLSIAEKLDLSGVTSFELPALINSKENEVIYRTIASSAKNTIVKIPVGDNMESLELALKCVEGAKKACLQVEMPVSTAQMEYFYHLKANAMQDRIIELVKASKETGTCVEFVALDAFRAEKGFVQNLAKAVCDAGACAITLCDDAGEALIEDFELLVKEIKSVCDIKVFVQPSNNFSMASACAVGAIKAGADGVKVSTVGNYLSLSVFSEIIKSKKYLLDVDCSVDYTNVFTIDQAINSIATTTESSVSEEKVQNKPINSDLTIKDLSTMVKSLGYELTDEDTGKVYEEVKKLVVRKESIDQKELEAVIASTAMQVPSTYHLVNFVVNSGNIIPATANVTLEKDGEKITGVSTGDGPIDAAFHAIEQVIGHHYELDDFQVHAVTKGRGAVGSSIIRLRANGKLYPGNGVSTDIIGACIRAYINALNKIVFEEK